MLRLEAIGPVPAEEAWSRYVRPDRWSLWAPQIRRVVGLSSPVTADSQGWVIGPIGLRVPVRIVAVDHDARTWQWRVGLRPVAVVMDHGVEEVGDETRAFVRIHLPRLVALPYAPIARAALRRLVKPG